MRRLFYKFGRRLRESGGVCCDFVINISADDFCTNGVAVNAEPAHDAVYETNLAEDDIKDIQRGLGMSETARTGQYDAATRAALLQKQKDLGLHADGLLTAPLIRRSLSRRICWSRGGRDA